MTTEGTDIHSANLVDIVYGGRLPDVGDAAEDYVEASKLHRDAMGWDAPGVQFLEQTPAMHPVVARGYRGYESRRAVRLPVPAEVTMSLAEACRRRRSADALTGAGITLGDLSTLLRTAWEPVGSTGPRFGTQPRRPVPSAGALQPLDVWVVAHRVDGLPAGLYYARMPETGTAELVDMGPCDLQALAEASLQPEIVGEAAVTLVVSAMPWRQRFKYGQRALRFALIEAGHLVQTIQLVGSGIGLASRPLGGFVDDEVSRVVGLDGVDEVPLYVLPVGRG